MPASPITTGAVYVFIGVSAVKKTYAPPKGQYVPGQGVVAVGQGTTSIVTQRTPQYLGTGEVAPDMDLSPQYQEVMNDLTGTKVPADKIFEGQLALTHVNFTRWDERVLAFVEAVPNRASSLKGITQAGDIGSLMLAEGLAYDVWLWYARGATGPGANATMVALGMPPGRHYFASMTEGSIIRKPGTQVNKGAITWVHLPVLAKGGTGAEQLYDEDMSPLSLSLLS